MAGQDYTPGPWRISSSTLGAKLLIEHGASAEDSPIVGAVYSDDGRLPQRANARLIAAAPELLQALKGLAEWCNDNFAGEDSGPWADLKLSYEAIAKAEGREP